MKREIDINCDVGEGIGNEAELLPLISSCNIACGGHAGNLNSMRNVVQLAMQHGVKVGAHPSYPDSANFGRLSIKIEYSALQQSIKEQVGALQTILEKERIALHHIKAHGALYNDIAKDENLARIFLNAIQKYKNTSFLYVPYGSVIETLAKKNGFTVLLEAFADRNYNLDLSLVSRKKSNALLEVPEEVLAHLVRMVKDLKVTTSEGLVKILADTYCIHGDTPAALQILTYLSITLAQHQIYIKK
ncbi:MAG: 5-oxoprolinase subunit PxpA [Cellulophaga sp.]